MYHQTEMTRPHGVFEAHGNIILQTVQPGARSS